MAKKPSKISPDLEKAVSKLLKETMSAQDATLSDKVKVLDRALKLEALKLKEDDTQFGSGFFDNEDDDDETK